MVTASLICSVVFAVSLLAIIVCIVLDDRSKGGPDMSLPGCSFVILAILSFFGAVGSAVAKAVEIINS